MRIGILLFDGVDLLDSGGPYEVFLTASRLAERTGSSAPFEVVTVSADGQPVTAYGGLGLVPQGSVGACGSLDVVIIPGTIDLDSALDNDELLSSVERLVATSTITTSVCTGAFFLGALGLLDDRPWTTHWEDVDLLAERFGLDRAERGVRWVDSGDVITSGGLTAGIDMALHVVGRVAGLALAQATARQIDHPWSADPAEMATS